MSTAWKPISILAGVFALMVFFQNCSSAVPFGTVDRFAKLVESDVFPYEATFDQIAYMSCSEQENVTQDFQTFFTFRVGAYHTGGVRVTEDFRDEVIRLNDDTVVNALMQNEASKNTRLQLGLRSLTDLKVSYVHDSSSDGIEGKDFSNMLTTFGTEGFTDLLWHMEPGDYLQYWAGAQFDSDYRFEGTINFTASELIETGLRNFLSNDGLLAVTFLEQDSTLPRGPNSMTSVIDENVSVRQAFGMAVSPRFKQPLPPGGGSPGSSMPSRVLSSIQEIAIDPRKAGTIPRSWSCPSQLNFMIVLPEDAFIRNGDNEITGTRCAMNPDPVQLPADLKLVRKSLYAEDWYVDMARGCVVPKAERTTAGSCYGINSQTQQTHIINYDNFPAGCGFGSPNGLCPHYTSICFMQ